MSPDVVVDVGNSRIKWGRCARGAVAEVVVLPPDTPDVWQRHLLDPRLRVLSHEEKARKPSERLFRRMLELLEQRGLSPAEVLHVGAHVAHDVVPARRLGMRTALFAGDKASLQATPEQLKDPARRPDVLLTELGQIGDVVPGP